MFLWHICFLLKFNLFSIEIQWNAIFCLDKSRLLCYDYARMIPITQNRRTIPDMLYDPNKPFTEQEFQNPGKEYRGTPFWAWNAALDRQELLRQIGCLKQMGFGGFHMHVRFGMISPYMII